MLRAGTDSAIHSAMMSRAPANASSGDLTSPLTKRSAAACGSGKPLSDIIIRANGSNPRSRAIEARVRRLGRYGRYKSSSSAAVEASLMRWSRSSESLSCCRMASMIASRRSSRRVRRSISSCMLLISISLRLPVTSLRYRLIKGIVAPDARSWAVARTLFTGKLSRRAAVSIMSAMVSGWI